MSSEREQSLSFQDRFVPIGQDWLEFLAENRELDKERRQKLLKDIWESLSVLYPKVGDKEESAERRGDTKLVVPSDRLIALGLVSEQVAGEITEIKKRKEESSKKISSAEPFNTITIYRTDEGFRVEKIFMSEKTSYVGAFNLRIDTLKKEETIIGKSNEGYYLKVRAGKADVHLHTSDNDKPWFLKGAQEEELKEVEVSPRDLIRTLVLLIEGIAPNCLKPPNITSE